MSTKKFGRPIKISEAHDLVTEGMNIKNRHETTLAQLTENDSEATRFFLGGDVMYIFSKDQVQVLLNRLKTDEDCLVIFPASRKDEPGRPTLILLAYSLKDGKLHLQLDSSGTANEDGSEHPGGNGKLRLTTITASSEEPTRYEIPVSIDPRDIAIAFQ